MHRVLSRLRTMSVHMHVYVVEMSGHFERVDNLLHWCGGFEMTGVVSRSLTGLLPPELSFSWLYTLLKLSRLEVFNLTSINWVQHSCVRNTNIRELKCFYVNMYIYVLKIVRIAQFLPIRFCQHNSKWASSFVCNTLTNNLTLCIRSIWIWLIMNS